MKYRFLSIAALTASALISAPASDQIKAEVALRAATERAEVNGDFKGAIEQLKALAVQYRSDHAIAARALLKLGLFQERLGNEQAQTTYKRIVSGFADRPEAAEARRRLDATIHASTGVSVRQIWTGADVDPEASIASDGRSIVATDWVHNPAGILLHDLATSENRQFALTTGDMRGYAEWPVLSPDMRQAAYAYWDPESGNYQLRSSSLGPAPNSKVLYRNREFNYYFALGWSLDSKSVLALMFQVGNASRLAWVSAFDGAVKQLRSFDWQSPGLISLSPDGKYIAYDVLSRKNSKDREIHLMTSDGSSDAVVANGPSTNASPVWSRDGSGLLFTSNRTGSTGLWRLGIRDGKPSADPVLVRPQIGEVALKGVTRDGCLIYVQKQRGQNIFSAAIDPATNTSTAAPELLANSFLGSNASPAWSPDRKRIAYLSFRTNNGVDSWESSVVIRSLDGSEILSRSTVHYASKPAWTHDGRQVIVSARDSQNMTALYRINAETGVVEEIMKVGGQGGPQASLSADGHTVFSNRNGSDVVALDVVTGQSKTLYSGHVRLVAVSPDATRVAFENLEGPESRPFLKLVGADGSHVENIDISQTGSGFITAIAWSSDSRAIYFSRRPKERGSHSQKVYAVTVETGQIKDTGISGEDIGSLDVTADGRQLAFTAGKQITAEYWSIDNLDPKLRTRK